MYIYFVIYMCSNRPIVLRGKIFGSLLKHHTIESRLSKILQTYIFLHNTESICCAIVASEYGTCARLVCIICYFFWLLFLLFVLFFSCWVPLTTTIEKNEKNNPEHWARGRKRCADKKRFRLVLGQLNQSDYTHFVFFKWIHSIHIYLLCESVH